MTRLGVYWNLENTHRDKPDRWFLIEADIARLSKAGCNTIWLDHDPDETAIGSADTLRLEDIAGRYGISLVVAPSAAMPEMAKQFDGPISIVFSTEIGTAQTNWGVYSLCVAGPYAPAEFSISGWFADDNCNRYYFGFGKISVTVPAGEARLVRVVR